VWSEQFPPYAPDLNPDEYVWQHLKHVELRNSCCDDLVHLSTEVKHAVNRLRRKPTLIHPSLQEPDWSFERFSYQCVKE
jgi:transposase